jgi:hypothetical protein
MTYALGIISSIGIGMYVLYTWRATTSYTGTIASRSRRRAIMIRAIANILVLLTIISMIVLSVLGISYLYGFAAFLIALLGGGILSFVFDMIAHD